MKILFILENYYPNVGGVEKLFKSLAEELSAKGHMVTIITTKIRPNLPFKEELANVTIYRYPFKNRYLFTLLAFFPALYFAFRHDLIQTTSYNAGIPAFFAGVFSRKKVVITFHEVWGKLWFKLPFFSKWSLGLHYIFEKVLLKFPFYHFITDSDFSKGKLIQSGIPELKITRIYPGLIYKDFEDYLGGERKSNTQLYTFIYFGRLGISKGLDVLLKASYLLQKEVSDFKLVLILPKNPASLLNKVKELITGYGLSKKTTILHELTRDDLYKQVSQAHCVVVPSYSEGFGFVAAESVALQKPIISSEQGSLKEVVSGKFLAFENQDPESLKNAMSKALLNNWDYRESKKFTLKDTVEDYLKLYMHLIG